MRSRRAPSGRWPNARHPATTASAAMKTKSPVRTRSARAMRLFKGDFDFIGCPYARLARFVSAPGTGGWRPRGRWLGFGVASAFQFPLFGNDAPSFDGEFRSLGRTL